MKEFFIDKVLPVIIALSIAILIILIVSWLFSGVFGFILFILMMYYFCNAGSKPVPRIDVHHYHHRKK